ncbi:hypothetical protein COLO4_02440 [Corchorus olitorius]|uniref:Uncharacterized protein n=1 Tax=Corchorus olitorius TaxID=93759 RepID=A0A1R3L138_9ROSI|nr:hypothetical protein COLO4_02440 [Corchorus olitorius]
MTGKPHDPMHHVPNQLASKLAIGLAPTIRQDLLPRPVVNQQGFLSESKELIRSTPTPAYSQLLRSKT